MFDALPQEISTSSRCSYPSHATRPRSWYGGDRGQCQDGKGRCPQSRRRKYRNYNVPMNSQSEDAMVCHGFRNSANLVEEQPRDQCENTSVSSNSSYTEQGSSDSERSSSDEEESYFPYRAKTLNNTRRRNCNRNDRRNGNSKRKNTLLHAVRSEYIAMDCEMVGTGPDGKISTLARVSLVDWYGTVLLDTYVEVREPVTDLRTHVSGVTLEKIAPESPYAMDHDECVNLVQQLIYGKVLVGHGLKNDLEVLQITHPWYDIRDTTKYEPFMREAGRMLLPRKLKDLAEEKLGSTIQSSAGGHDSTEDAWAAMQLYKLVGSQWDRIMQYKVKKTIEIAGLQNVHDECMQPNFQNGYALTVRCS